MDTLTLIPDEPCLDIGKVPALDAIAEQMTDAIIHSRTPLVIGLNGDWGSGKTSFLHHLQYLLTGDCAQNGTLQDYRKTNRRDAHPLVEAVWFEAWRYQQDPAPVVALLHEIRSQLSFKAQALMRARKITEVAIRGALMSIEDVTQQIGFKASAIQDAGEKWEREHLATTLPSSQLRELLDDVLGKLLGATGKGEGKKERRLVVFIDDLDRCESETALRLLEGLKIYLNLRRCVFVLGLNQREVERALGTVLPHNKSDGDASPAAGPRAHEYLEKICANIWHLPPLGLRDQQSLVAHWCTEFSLLPPAPVAFLQDLIATYRFLPPNARRIKAFLNGFARLRQRWAWRDVAQSELPAEETEADLRVFAIFAALQQFHSRLWRHLESEPNFYQELYNYARGTAAKTADKDDPSLAAFCDLVLPEVGVWPDSERAPQIEPSWVSRFADRSYANVLFAQRLIAATPLEEARVEKFLGF